MESRTLVLSPWYLPYRIVSWQHAITLVYLEKVDVLSSYGEIIRSPSTSIAKPAVIRMRRHHSGARFRVRFSRRNVLMRDGYCCMYCGKQLSLAELTFDHVQPRSHGGRTDWTNILSCCGPCNAKKGNRTPSQAGMRPLRLPFKPKSLPMRSGLVELKRVPREWKDFCLSTTPHSSDS